MTASRYILQINVAAGRGSTGRIASGIAQELEQAGHRTQIAYGRGNASEADAAFRIGSSLNVALHGTRSLLFDSHGLGSVRATANLVKIIQCDTPDLVVLHNLHGYYLNYPLLFEALGSLQIAVAWVLHDCWAFTGHCAYFDRIDCRRWRNGCGDCPLTQQYPMALIDRSARNWRLKRDAATSIERGLVITPSQWLTKHVEQSFLKDWSRKVIPNGVDMSIFRAHADDGPDSDRPIVLGVAAGWPERKGLEDLCALRKVLPTNWRIVLIGVTERQKRRLPDGVEGVVRTGNMHELARHYAQAAVYVNPTHIDNFPTTNIEALACGAPVVTYDTGGSPESLSADVGAVVPRGDHEALARAVLVWGQRGLGRATRAACRAHASRKFDARARFADHVAAYEGLIGS